MTKSYRYGQDMDFGEVVSRRRMCRDFSDRPVDPELVDRLLDQARRAPSAGYSQGVGFLVLSTPAERDRFWAETSDAEWRASELAGGIMRAPVIVVPMCSAAVYVARYSEPDKVGHGLTTVEAWPVPFWTVDAAFSTMTLLLGVVDQALGALFFGFQTREAIGRFREAFAVPETWAPIGVMALGWPAGTGGARGSAATRPRRPLSEVVRWGRW
jgi:nitroreductase